MKYWFITVRTLANYRDEHYWNDVTDVHPLDYLANMRKIQEAEDEAGRAPREFTLLFFHEIDQETYERNREALEL